MNDVQTAIYYKVIGQILRHFLTIAAGYVLVVGVDLESKNALVEAMVNQIVPLIVIGAMQLWGILVKRTSEYRARYALAADPQTTTLADVDRMVAAKTPPAVQG